MYAGGPVIACNGVMQELCYFDFGNNTRPHVHQISSFQPSNQCIAYLDCYFGTREQKQILIIENHTIVFKLFLMEIYALFIPLNQFKSTFALLLMFFRNFLNAATASSDV